MAGKARGNRAYRRGTKMALNEIDVDVDEPPERAVTGRKRTHRKILGLIWL
jgi:hypothetical protein